MNIHDEIEIQKEFEKWCVEQEINREKSLSGGYINEFCRIAWIGWLAALKWKEWNDKG